MRITIRITKSEKINKCWWIFQRLSKSYIKQNSNWVDFLRLLYEIAVSTKNFLVLSEGTIFKVNNIRNPINSYREILANYEITWFHYNEYRIYHLPKNSIWNFDLGWREFLGLFSSEENLFYRYIVIKPKQDFVIFHWYSCHEKPCQYVFNNKIQTVSSTKPHLPIQSLLEII